MGHGLAREYYDRPSCYGPVATVLYGPVNPLLRVFSLLKLSVMRLMNSECCLYDADCRISVLDVTRFQRAV